MKLKHLLIPYTILIVVFPAIISHLAVPLKLNVPLCENIMDGVMILTASVGMVSLLIRKKSQFKGWLPLAGLLLLVVLPQLYLWKTQNRGFYELRIIYRFALLYITLFIIPLEVHLHRREICLIIGIFCIFGLICCIYELVQHPRVWEYMNAFSGKGSHVESFFGQKNRFGAYCALWLIISFFAEELTGNKLWFIPAAFFGCFLVLTESRGGLVLTAIFCLGFLLSFRKRLGTKTILMILADLAIVLCVLFIIPQTRDILMAVMRPEDGVTGRDRIWAVAWNYYLESNPLIGHGLGTQIERVMIEQINSNVNTHNMYLYILNCGGIVLVIFYIFSFVILFRRGRYRHHYLIPFLIAYLVYGFFEMAAAPFDYWHLSNMFSICLFSFPAYAGMDKKHHHRKHSAIHAVVEE